MDELSHLEHAVGSAKRRATGRLTISWNVLAVLSMAALFFTVHAKWFTRVPGDLDAFNFVLGVRDFDPARHRPHPPGAPIFIAGGKAATWLWQQLGLPVDPLAGPEAAALGGLSLIAGTLSILLVWRLLRRLDGPSSDSMRTTLIVASAPLLWVLAARRVSDISGLLLVLVTYLAAARRQPNLAAALAGISMGLRVQTALLTIPAVVIAVARARSWKAAAIASGSCAAGVVVWLAPLLVLSGGTERYWSVLAEQAGHDLLNPAILAASPTFRSAADALLNTFVRPWGAPALAGAVLAAALVGAVRLVRVSGRRAAMMAVCAAPYLAFHLTLQETATIRYALPIVLGVAFLAAFAIEGGPRRWRSPAAALLVAANLFVSVRTVQAYSREGAPAMALLRAMYRRAAVKPPAFVTGHSDVMLPQLQQVLAAPPWLIVSPPVLYEWRSGVEHWSRGERTPIWYVADPRRTDLSLIDRRSRRVLGSFRLKVQDRWMLKGLRPRAITWYELRPPAWVAIRGFATTPEVGGLAERDRHGPAYAGAVALIRRSRRGGVLMVGGRHVGRSTDPPVRVTIEVDGRAVSHLVADARERGYVTFIHLRPDELTGATPYATVTIRSAAPGATPVVVPVTVEQFDYQPGEGLLFAYGSGWHEPEFQPATGRTWRWAGRRATLRVHRRPGEALELKMSGDMPRFRRTKSARVRIVSQGRTLDTFGGPGSFSRRVGIPADPSGCEIEIGIESTFSFIPAAEGVNRDRRELAFRVFEIDVDSARASR